MTRAHRTLTLPRDDVAGVVEQVARTTSSDRHDRWRRFSRCGQVLSLDVLDHEVAVGILYEVVDDNGKGGVTQGGEKLRFVFERAIVPPSDHLLYGHRVAQTAVRGLVDRAHATSADLGDDAITVVRHAAWLEREHRRI